MTAAASPPPAKHRPQSSPEERALAVQWYAEGDSSSEIAARFGRSKAWVINVVRAANENRPASEAQRPSRVRRREMFDEVARRLRTGESQRSITLALGFHVPALIWQVRNGLVHAPELLAVAGPARPCRRRTC